MSLDALDVSDRRGLLGNLVSVTSLSMARISTTSFALLLFANSFELLSRLREVLDVSRFLRFFSFSMAPSMPKQRDSVFEAGVVSSFVLCSGSPRSVFGGSGLDFSEVLVEGTSRLSGDLELDSFMPEKLNLYFLLVLGPVINFLSFASSSLSGSSISW